MGGGLNWYIARHPFKIQFDYFRLMPGGLDGLARVIQDLKAAGVRVLWPYNPWDTGTRREGAPDAEVLAKLLRQTGGDGLNGDTMAALPQSFWDAGARLGHPLALEAELGGSDESIISHAQPRSRHATIAT